MTKIGFIGTGQMAQALAGGISANDSSVSFVVSDPSPDAIEAFSARVGNATVETVASNADVFGSAEIVFLAVKPQYFRLAIDTEAVAAAIANRDASPLIVSIMAGIEIAKIQIRTSIDCIIRVMPNTPCLVGAGASGMACSDSVSVDQRETVMKFMATTGIVLPIAENLLDAVTGLSGSGPAYIFEFIDALALGGVKCGLPRSVASELAAQTVFGAAKLAIESGEHPAVLRDRVTSPGGTTIAGLTALYNNGFQQATIAAVEAATGRSKELG